MERGIRIAGVVVFLLGIFLEWQAVQLRYYTELGPGPGFFAVWLAGILTVLGFVVAVRASGGATEQGNDEFLPSRRGYFRMAVVILAIGGMAYSMERVGYRVSAFLFLIVLGYVFGMRNWLLLLGAALLGSFGIFYVFNDLLSSPLPRGAFGI